MDDRQFDEITRALARIRSRRTVLKTGVGAALAGGALAARGRGVARADHRIFGVCHATGAATNPFVYIEPAQASTHLDDDTETPRPGHEGDRAATREEFEAGACFPDDTTTTTTTEAPTTTTTTTVAGTTEVPTTTTAAPTTTTTRAPSVTTPTPSTSTTVAGVAALPSTGVGSAGGGKPDAGPALALLGAAAVLGRSVLRRIRGAESE